jgi:hypothetical protein
MGRRTPDEQRRYMATYRSDPLAAAVNRWYTRTESLALRELAKRHRAEYLRVLYEIREADPKPEAAEGTSDAAA